MEGRMKDKQRGQKGQTEDGKEVTRARKGQKGRTEGERALEERDGAKVTAQKLKGEILPEHLSSRFKLKQENMI